MFNKTEYVFIIKEFKTLGMGGNYINIIQPIYELYR